MACILWVSITYSLGAITKFIIRNGRTDHCSIRFQKLTDNSRILSFFVMKGVDVLKQSLLG